ncbi:MAG: hypothetical protein AB1489_30550 [Acidobacteriota bacterium]
MTNHSLVWVFNGVRSNFPSAIFSNRELAEDWIKKYQLTGTLTVYPVDISAYEWSIINGYFHPKKDEHFSPEFIGRFSSGHEHYHYEEGECKT